jgi:tetratricopeptide (TPR) repeat protein
MKFKLALILFIFFFSIINASADFNKGFKTLINNKRLEAIELLKVSSSEGDEKSFLANAYAYWCMGQEEEAFTQINKYYGMAANPYPCIYSLWSLPFMFSSSVHSNEKLMFLEKLANDLKAPGTLRSMANSSLGDYYFIKNDPKKSTLYYNLVKTIDQWLFLGGFDNTSGSGFTKDYGAITNKNIGDKFKNIENADVTWFKPPYYRTDKWVDFDFSFVISNQIFYAQSFVKSPDEREVYIRAGCSGSMKIWLNDAIICIESQERNSDQDIYNYKVKLNAGYNRILVQIGESEVNNANFMVRLTDDNGNSYKDLTCIAEVQDYAAAEKAGKTKVKFFAEQFFLDQNKEKPIDLYSLIHAESYLRNDRVYEARKILKTLKEKYPNSSLISHRLMEAYQRDENKTDLTKEIEHIQVADPTCISSFQFRISDAIDKEDYVEMEKLLDNMEEIYGKNDISAEMYRLQLTAYQKKNNELILMVNKLYKKYPDNWSIVNLYYDFQKGANKNLNDVNKILINFLKRNYNNSALIELSNNYLKLGKKGAAIALLEKRLQLKPHAIGFYSDFADFYFDNQDYKTCLTYLDKALAMGPYSADLWASKAKVYKELNDESLAIECFTKAIKYNPTDYDSRKELRELKKQKNLFEYFKKYDAEEIYNAAPKASQYPNDNSLILLYNIQKIIYKESASEMKTEMVVKVFNQEGINDWKEYNIGSGYSQRGIIEKAEVFKSNGKKLQAETDGGHLVFTDLEAGDAIHILWRNENYFSGKLAEHFFDQFILQYGIPVQELSYNMLVPNSKPFKHHVLNGDIEPTITEIEKMKLYTWERKDVPSLKSEIYRPSFVDVVPTLDYSSIPDWAFVADWYADLSETKAKSDFQLKETVSELFADKDSLSPLATAKVIYEYILKNVNYSNVSFMHGAIIPQKASRTLSTKLGDCKDVSTLFVAMCRERGISANLRLIDTKNNGKNNLNLPNIGFNHCIAEFTLDGQKNIVELTDNRLPFLSLPGDDVDANSLWIPFKNETAENILAKNNAATRVKSEIVRKSKIKLVKSDIEMKRLNTRIGASCSYIRNVYIGLGKDEQDKKMHENIAGDFTTPTKLKIESFRNLENLEDTLDYTYNFTITKALTEVAGIKLIKLPWADAVLSLNFVALETRTQAFNYAAFTDIDRYSEEIEFTLPDGSKLAEMPKNVNLECNVAKFEMAFKMSKSGKLIATRTFTIKSDTVLPADYIKFKEFYSSIAELDTKQYALKGL